MALCDCADGPKCEYQYCGARADYTALVPASWNLPLRLRAKFYCKSCWEHFSYWWTKPIKGITRPPGDPEDWKGSLLECIRHAQIAMIFNERNNQVAQDCPVELSMPGDEKFTPAQLSQIHTFRKLSHLLRNSQYSGER